MKGFARAGVIVLVLLAALCSGQQKLPKLNVKLEDASLGGLSAGGYFAVQMHVAYSDIFRRVAVFAGGPYHCAQGDMNTALTTCMNPILSPPNPNLYIKNTRDNWAKKLIADPANLFNDTVFMFGGTLDGTVKPVVMQALHTYYKEFVTKNPITYINTYAAGHTMPTDDPSLGPCDKTQSPWVANCRYDGAGEALKKFYTHLNPRNTGTLEGRVLAFDQTEFIRGQSMSKVGYVFIPKACDRGEPCKLHISFHGCEQYADGPVKTTYVEKSGWNKWADTNNIVVLYPQAVNSGMLPLNPKGCFNWWGYNTDPFIYDTRNGTQMKAVRAMMDRLAGLS